MGGKVETMASKAAADGDELECPVCHDNYTDPKMLPCAHIVCHKCVVSWLGRTGGRGGCPLCRAPILPSADAGQVNISGGVDGLPTDLTVLALVESQRVLSGSHVCSICENGIVATSYCLQCCVKLCRTCTKGHVKYPTFGDHVLEDLDKLTVQSLVSSRRSTCNSHSGRVAEMYCSVHSQLICYACAMYDHRACADIKKIADMATVKRAELEERAQRLKDKETALSKQVDTVKEQYSALRAKVKDTFDDLQSSVEKRRKEVNSIIQEDEAAAMASFAEVNSQRSVLTSHAGSIQHLIVEAPDNALLEMLEKLTLRLDYLESQPIATAKVKAAVEVNFKPNALGHAKTIIAKLGHTSHDGAWTSHDRTDSAQTAGAAPSGAAVTAATVPPPAADNMCVLDEVWVEFLHQAIPAPSQPKSQQAKREKAKHPPEVGITGKVEQMDKTRSKQRTQAVQLSYKEGQWSPVNPEGKKQYDREFLLKLQVSPASRKAPSLPHMPEIMVDPRSVKIENLQKAQALAAARTCPDFTPGFFKSTPRSGGPGGSLNKRSNPQRRHELDGYQDTEQKMTKLPHHQFKPPYKSAGLIPWPQEDADTGNLKGSLQYSQFGMNPPAMQQSLMGFMDKTCIPQSTYNGFSVMGGPFHYASPPQKEPQMQTYGASSASGVNMQR